jgi:hypothetical protein
LITSTTGTTTGSNYSVGSLQVFSGVQHTSNYTAYQPIGGNLLTVNSTNVIIPSTTVSSSTSTGALQVVGGIGVGGDIYCPKVYQLDIHSGFVGPWIFQTGSFFQQANVILDTSGLVHVSLPSVVFTPTSNSSKNLLSTTLPSNIKPNSQRYFIIMFYNDGAYRQASLTIYPGFDTIWINAFEDYETSDVTLSFDITYDLSS